MDGRRTTTGPADPDRRGMRGVARAVSTGGYHERPVQVDDGVLATPRRAEVQRGHAAGNASQAERAAAHHGTAADPDESDSANSRANLGRIRRVAGAVADVRRARGEQR